uniref:Uncharacterized protein n=1 Tax=Sparus aurata TaxID=8175 RepID=A0A671XX22_SPAAU
MKQGSQTYSSPHVNSDDLQQTIGLYNLQPSDVDPHISVCKRNVHAGNMNFTITCAGVHKYADQQHHKIIYFKSISTSNSNSMYIFVNNL